MAMGLLFIKKIPDRIDVFMCVFYLDRYIVLIFQASGANLGFYHKHFFIFVIKNTLIKRQKFC
jgi:hypothetical protein